MNPFDTILITFIILIIFYFIFSKYTAQHLSEILTLVGGIGLTISSIQANSIEKFFGETTWKDSTTYIMCVSALISLIGIIVSIYRRSKQNTIENILNENKKLRKGINELKNEYYKLCSDEIKFMFDSFLCDSESRVSIYKHLNNEFILLGRFSKNSEYNYFNNKIYPDNVGFISLGWENGVLDDQNAPLWKKNKASYIAYMKNHSRLDKETLTDLKMKSCSFFIYALRDNSSNNPKGIIVFERITPNSINSDNIKVTLEIVKPKLMSFLENMTTLTQSFDDAINIKKEKRPIKNQSKKKVK